MAANAQASPVDEVPGASRSAFASAEEALLVTRLRAGDEEAYRQLLERYGGRMLSVARGVLKDEEEALDARQDALLSLVRSLDEFAGEALLSTWLHRVLINACLMRLRSTRRRGPTVSLEEIGGGDSPIALPRGGHTPVLWESEVRLQRAEVRARVLRRLRQLPERYRVVVLLRDVRELPTREVAEILGISENAVKIRLHRARRAARALLENDAKRGHLMPWKRQELDNDTMEGPTMAKKTAKKPTTKAASRKRHSKTRDPEELHAAIRERAYEIYLDRGEANEGDMDNWLCAEAEILGEGG